MAQRPWLTPPFSQTISLGSIRLLWRKAFVAALILTAPMVTKAPTALAAAPRVPEIMTEPVYDGGLKGSWEDQGWAPRDTLAGQAARLNFADLAGWILVRRTNMGATSALTFQIRAPSNFGDFLEVYLGNALDDGFPKVAITEALRRPMAEGDHRAGWWQIRVPIGELNPKGLSFDRFTIRARRSVAPSWVELGQIGFVTPIDGNVAAARSFDSRRVSLQVDCSRPSRPISPKIYGVAFNPRRDSQDNYVYRMGTTIRRWGGNPASRYNWRLGDAWNTAADWFYMNVNYTGITGYSWQRFLADNRKNGVTSAMTMPMLGFVAKDTQSYSYPVSLYGPQHSTFGSTHDIGNGIGVNGKFLPGADTRRTSIPAPPEFIGSWVEAIRRWDADNGDGRSVDIYFLDNEPTLWNSTHHDVHPDPVSYDELLRLSIAYASAIRRADPDANIAGPAAWGWPALFYSGVDAMAGFSKKPDRLAHGDKPLLAWYLQKMHEHQQKTGEHLLDTLDVHFYPETDGVHGGHERFDDATSAKRIRATRSLWHPTYKDESWIAETIRLIPRLKETVAENFPGLKLSIGEYNFGGERHISGGLAQAEALGRFGQSGVDAAFNWTYPPEGSPAFYAFGAFRNYDQKGSHFLERSLSTSESGDTSLFASTNAQGDKVVAIALNLDGQSGADVDLDVVGAGNLGERRVFQYTGGPDGFVPLTDGLSTSRAGGVRTTLPPYSITVFEFQIKKR